MWIVHKMEVKALIYRSSLAVLPIIMSPWKAFLETAKVCEKETDMR